MSTIYHGKRISDGIAIGKLTTYRKQEKNVLEQTVIDSNAEMKHFLEVLKTAQDEYKELYKKTYQEIGKDSAQLFEAYRLLLEDPDFLEVVKYNITSGKMNAVYAVKKTSQDRAILLESVNDPFFLARKAEIETVYQHLVDLLNGYQNEQTSEKEPLILWANDISPVDFIKMNSDTLKGIILQKGTEHSHLAILVRAKGIPAVIQSDMKISEAMEGKLLILDAGEGVILLDPEDKTRKEYQSIIQSEKEVQRKKEIEVMKDSRKEYERSAGNSRRVEIYANISSLDEARYAIQQEAEGIGLFRSEYLFLNRMDYPSEEEQFRIYKAVAEGMAGRRVILRTLDIGADKQAEYFGVEKEENPAMGYRAIRLCLDRTEVFKTQLRAILRAAAFGKVDLLLPMIISCSEVIRVKKFMKEIKDELVCSGLPYGSCRLGIMIETPAAVMISDLLASEVEFFSIGTNDLTQYTLACDRQNHKLESIYDTHHPAILRMIRLVADNAHSKGLRVGICGELAADLSLTQEFVQMGIDELSVSPVFIPSLRGKLMELY